MRRRILPVLMLSALLLSGCGSEAEKTLDEARARLREDCRLLLTVQLQADCGDALEHYSLDYTLEGPSWQATVISPEILAGIQAECTGDASTLTYDEVVLSTGTITQRGLSPLTAVPLAIQALKEGLVETLWTEGEYAVCRVRLDEALTCTLWLDAAGLPRAAELAEQGRVQARCKFTYAEIKESNHGRSEETNLGGD